MDLVHIELSVANQMVALVHRHHLPVAGHRFSLGAVKDARLVGVAIVGRPVARMRDQVNEAEVLRIATDGTKNACSFLLGACGRAAKALGYVRIQTFTLEIEGGGSLLAAGWKRDGDVDYGSWDRPSRGRDKTKHPTSAKVRWSRTFHDIVEYEQVTTNPESNSVTQRGLFE